MLIYMIMSDSSRTSLICPLVCWLKYGGKIQICRVSDESSVDISVQLQYFGLITHPYVTLKSFIATVTLISSVYIVENSFFLQVYILM